MALYTSVQAGPWHQASSWDLGAVPGNGDRAVINHDVTVSDARVIGTNPALATAGSDGETIGAIAFGEAPDATVTVHGPTTTLPKAGPRNFWATVTGLEDQTVAWTCTGGTINEHGRYVAPDVEGTYTVRATASDETAYDEITVTVEGEIELGMTGPATYYDPIGDGSVHEDYNPALHITPNLGDIDLLPRGGSPLSSLVTPVRDLPVSPYSDEIMAFFRPPSWGVAYKAGVYSFDLREPSGMPLSVVRSSETPSVPVTWAGEDVNAVHSDPGPWPIPVGNRVQGYGVPDSPTAPVMSDSHIFVVDIDTMNCYEAYHSYKDGEEEGWIASNGWYYNLVTGQWAAGLDPSHPNYVPVGGHRFPSVIVNAAALPMLPLAVRYEEIYEHGEIRHKIGLTLRNEKLGGTWIWPAQGMASWNRNQLDVGWGATLPYGATLRLREDWYREHVEDAEGNPIGTWGPGCRVVLRAYYEYGLIVTDGGNNGDIWVVADSRFITENRYHGDLTILQYCPLGAFEVVDFEDDLLSYTVTPEVEAEGIERTITVTCHLWDRHPEAHPGNPSIVAEDGSRLWQYGVQLQDAGTGATFSAYLAPGETNVADNLRGQFSPDHPSVSFLYTPSWANPRFFPETIPLGIPYSYHTGNFGVWTTEVNAPVTLALTPNPATITPGGTQQFTPVLGGTANSSVFWSTDAPGSIVDGLFTSNGTPGSGIVAARLLVDQRVIATASLTIGDDEGPSDPPDAGIRMDRRRLMILMMAGGGL